MSTSIPGGGLPVTGRISRLIDLPFVARKLTDAEISQYTARGIRDASAEAKPDSTPAASYATIREGGVTKAITMLPRPALKRATDEEARQLAEMNRAFEAARATDRKSDDDPSNLYATIQKNGKTIASLYVGGSMVTPNDVALPGNLSWDGQGTILADRRIQQMLALHGGTVVYARDVQARNAAAQAASLFTAQLAGQASA
jgi:hypothetical protein